MAKTPSTSFDFPIDLSVTDISEQCFIILMEAARSAQEDLREVMAAVQAINDAKSETRATMARVNCDIAANADQQGGKPPLRFSGDGLGSAKAYRQLFLVQPDPTSLGGVRRVPADPSQTPIKDVASLRAIHEQARNNLDSLSDLSELTSLRLQMVMDRRSKAMTTLSNLLKAISDTQNTLVGNLK